MANKQSTEAVVSEIHKKIRAAFSLFDFKLNNTVDVREIGTIIYSLGCFPSKAELQDFIAEIEEDHTTYIHLDKFLPIMTKVLLEHRFSPISQDLLFQAFEVLDKEKKGYLEPEELTKYLTEEGEPFSQNEMDEMLTAAVDHEKNIVSYKGFVNELIVESDK
ncbi:dynein regulatory complex protein 8 [Thalassophryne amazonica]|uniref:dynein regulatory complex protein 8 n=1 Tax=Thalassophryne amazonica TaxID=390379 RepID=UPI001471EA5B|nr:dynein regulatory complex protein 8 [Thalassophryne amazonica]